MALTAAWQAVVAAMRRTTAGTEHIDVVADQIGSPTYVGDLCAALLELAAMPDLRGPMNMGGGQSLSRWDFGLKLLYALRLPAVPYLVQALGDAVVTFS